MNPVLEPWLRGDPGDDDRCPGSQDLTGDALTRTVAELASHVLVDAGRRGKLELGTIRRHEHDRSSDHAQLGLEHLENLEQHLLLAGTGGQDLGGGVKRTEIAMRRTSAVHASKWGDLVPVEQVHAVVSRFLGERNAPSGWFRGGGFLDDAVYSRGEVSPEDPSRKPGADPGIAPGGFTRSNIPEAGPVHRSTTILNRHILAPGRPGVNLPGPTDSPVGVAV